MENVSTTLAVDFSSRLLPGYRVGDFLQLQIDENVKCSDGHGLELLFRTFCSRMNWKHYKLSMVIIQYNVANVCGI